jgi:DNA adenine methylase
VTPPTRYPGGKNGAGTWQKLLNQMPPHRWYAEPFLGSGALLRRKRPAERSWGIDLDPAVIAQWEGHEVPHLTLLNIDAREWLEAATGLFGPGDLLYADPPYPGDTRTSGALYRHELRSNREHQALLSLLRRQRCMVMVSSYWSPLYAEALRDWRSVSFYSATRAGMREEWLWCNFPEPQMLHDYSQLGGNFREREKYRRRVRRLRAKLLNLPPVERLALLEAWQDLPD